MTDFVEVSGPDGEAVMPWIPSRIDRFYTSGTDHSVMINFSRYYKLRHGTTPKQSPPIDWQGPEANA